jgi:4,5-DOPA dioxygenase extradiol
VQYPAPGSPSLANEIQELIAGDVSLDDYWGLDNGCWTVLKHFFPKTDVPVVELSLDYLKTAQEHYDLAKKLFPLRKQGILIVGSGNIVHNLGLAAWDKLDVSGFGYDWALEASEKMKQFILKNDHAALIDYRSHGEAYDLAIPTPEHYLPLLYALALKQENEKVTLFNDKPVAGSLTMTSLKIG